MMAGDDSIQRNVAQKESVRTASTWGFTLKFEMRQPGQSVDFLARHYSPGVWDNHPDNICSPLRTISKFHVSTLVGTVPSEVIAHSKAMSLLTNDSQTKLVGDWMRMIVRQTEPAFKSWCKGSKSTKLALLDVDKTWNDTWATGDGSTGCDYQAGNHSDTTWQDALFLREFTPENIEQFQKYLADPTSLWHTCPTLASSDAIPAATRYMANGEFVEPKPPASKAPDTHASATPDSDSPESAVAAPEAALPPGTGGPADVSTAPEEAQPPAAAAGPRSYANSASRFAVERNENKINKLKSLEQRTRKSADSVAPPATCKRGDKATGWYAGLGPCHAALPPGSGPYCKACKKVFHASAWFQ
jgi:hypothetical protein